MEKIRKQNDFTDDEEVIKAIEDFIKEVIPEENEKENDNKKKK